MKLGDLIASISRLKSVEASRVLRIALLKQLLQLVELQLQQCQPRDLAEIMLTCSKLGYGPAEVYQTCLDAVFRRLHQADARTLANVYMLLQQPQMIASSSSGVLFYSRSSAFLRSWASLGQINPRE
jgi:hypothetical protein